MRLIEQIKLQQKQELLRLVAHFGSQSNLARVLGVTKQAVHLWMKRGRISMPNAIQVEKLLPALFKKEDLRQDVENWSKYE
tara:strand:- start:405 stop:647 length:243 start_codon:yes stop_codon:yes gene_type:complete